LPVLLENEKYENCNEKTGLPALLSCIILHLR